jgi:hypothetical protein
LRIAARFASRGARAYPALLRLLRAGLEFFQRQKSVAVLVQLLELLTGFVGLLARPLPLELFQAQLLVAVRVELGELSCRVGFLFLGGKESRRKQPGNQGDGQKLLHANTPQKGDKSGTGARSIA